MSRELRQGSSAYDAIKNDQLGWIYPGRFTMPKDTMRIDGKTIRLSSGMNVTAEVKTGSRKIIEFILAPLKRYSAESLRER